MKAKKNNWEFLEIFLAFLYCVSAIALISFSWGRYVMALAAGGLLFLMLIQSKYNTLRGSELGFLVTGGLFVVFCFCSVFWAEHQDSALEMSVTMLEIYLCTCVVYHYIECTGKKIGLVRMLMFSGYIYALVVLFGFGIDNCFSISLNEAGREDSAFGNLNYIGMIMAVNLLFTVYDILTNRVKLYHLFSLVSFLILAMVQSRTAIFGLLAGVSVLFVVRFVKEKKWIRKLLIFFGTLILLLAFIWAFMNLEIFGGLRERMALLLETLTGGAGDSSSSRRLQLIGIGIEQFKKTPLLGIGMNNTHCLALEEMGHDYYLHNNYIDMLANGGVIGFLAFYSIYLVIGIRMLNYRKNMALKYGLILALWVSLLVMDMGTVSYYHKDIFLYLALMFLGTAPDRIRE